MVKVVQPRSFFLDNEFLREVLVDGLSYRIGMHKYYKVLVVEYDYLSSFDEST